MNAVMEKVKMGMAWRAVRFLEERRDCRLPGLLYTDDLVLRCVGGGPEGDGRAVCRIV